MIIISEISISSDLSVVDAMRIINKGSAQIALVVDQNQRLIGTLTDGDIRRGLLHGKSLYSPVSHLMNHNFRFVNRGDNKKDVLEMMRREVLSQIPVLDSDGRVIELLLLQEFMQPQELPNAVVIMAGGKGTRLRPYTENCPKPMLSVDGKPILEILLEQFIECGFCNFFFSVNYLKEHIINHFLDGKKWGVSIQYLEETTPLGTGGSLSLLPSNLAEPILVMNGDVLTRFNPNKLLNFHRHHMSSATVAVREHETTIPFGVVHSDGERLIGFDEKPTYRHLVNAGVYVLDPSMLVFLPKDRAIDMPDLIQDIQARSKKVCVCPIHEFWIDIGRPETLKEAHLSWDNNEK